MRWALCACATTGQLAAPPRIVRLMQIVRRGQSLSKGSENLIFVRYAPNSDRPRVSYRIVGSAISGPQLTQVKCKFSKLKSGGGVGVGWGLAIGTERGVFELVRT